MVTLVERLQSEKECRRRCGGSGPFTLPCDGWRVVGAAGDGLFANVEIVSCDVVLDDAGAPAFEVLIETLMGKKAETRFDYIQANAKFVADEIDV